MEKCIITNSRCIIHPSGLEAECFGHCPDAIGFLKFADLHRSDDVDKEEITLDLLKEELGYIENCYPLSKSFLKSCFKEVIKRIKKKWKL